MQATVQELLNRFTGMRDLEFSELEELIDDRNTWEIADAASGLLLAELDRCRDDRVTLDETLLELCPMFGCRDSWLASHTGFLAGLIVRFGGDPAICATELLARLQMELPLAEDANRALERLRVKYKGREERDLLLKLGAVQPQQLKALLGLNLFIVSAAWMLAKDSRLLNQARAQRLLRQHLDSARDWLPEAQFLGALLNMTDELELVVIHLAEGKGFRVRLAAIQNNMQLFILLEEELRSRAVVSGSPPRGSLCRLARGELLEDEHHSDASLSSPATWVERPWFAPRQAPLGQPKGVFECGKDSFIGMEHSPGEIPRFNGYPVILLDDPPLRYLHVHGFWPLQGLVRSHVTLVGQLTESETKDWLEAMASEAKVYSKSKDLSGCAICRLRKE